MDVLTVVATETGRFLEIMYQLDSWEEVQSRARPILESIQWAGGGNRVTGASSSTPVLSMQQVDARSGEKEYAARLRRVASSKPQPEPVEPQLTRTCQLLNKAPRPYFPPDWPAWAALQPVPITQGCTRIDMSAYMAFAAAKSEWDKDQSIREKLARTREYYIGTWVRDSGTVAGGKTISISIKADGTFTRTETQSTPSFSSASDTAPIIGASPRYTLPTTYGTWTLDPDHSISLSNGESLEEFRRGSSQ